MLRGSKVELGPIMPQDEPALFRWFNDTDAARLDLAYRPMHWTAFRRWVETSINDCVTVHFAIRDSASQSIVGYLFVSHIDPVHRSATVGIRIGEESARGKGYGREALHLVLGYCWRHLNLHRVSLVTVAANERAIRSFSAAGFQREAVLRHAVYLDGRWNDSLLMSAVQAIANHERTSAASSGPARPR